MTMELTYEELKKDFGDIKGLSISYNEGTRTVKFLSSISGHIYDLNTYLLDCYPSYLNHISYDVNDRNGNYWLELICIGRK